MKSIPIHKFSAHSSVPGFQVVSWSEKLKPYEANKPHRHQYFEALFFLKGKGIHEIDFKKHIFKPNSVHFVSSSTVHSVLREPGSIGFSILFEPDFLPQGVAPSNFTFFQVANSPVLNLGKNGFEQIRSVLSQIHEEYNGQAFQKREALQSLFHVLLIQLQRHYTSSEQQTVKVSKRPELAQRIELLIEQHYLNHWRAKDYALQLNTSVASLTNFCKKYFSMSAEQLAHQRLLLEVKRQLAYDNKNVKEICFDLGFEDPAYFNRFFKKGTGLTPVQYREALEH